LIYSESLLKLLFDGLLFSEYAVAAALMMMIMLLLLMITDHTFLRATEFRAEPRNLPFSAEFPYFR